MTSSAVPSLPIIDVCSLVNDRRGRADVTAQIAEACRESGFFYIVGHGIDDKTVERLESTSRAFFAQDLEKKRAVRMALGGRAWRGYFPVGGELTLGVPDQKEGIYFGAELDATHPLVRAGTPLHGANLFPPAMPDFRAAVLDYIDAMTRLGHVLMEGIAEGLGISPSYFADRLTGDPLVLFRIFNYPSLLGARRNAGPWSVGEHTDYGVLTILRQCDCGGLQVKVGSRWIDAPPVADSFVCNIGDMLDRMTNGLYRSTPHRVRNVGDRDRLSFAFFFDPSFDARVTPIEGLPEGSEDRDERWDGLSVRELGGTYGDYLLRKVGRVFPELGEDVL